MSNLNWSLAVGQVFYIHYLQFTVNLVKEKTEESDLYVYFI